MDFLLHFGPSHYNDLFRCDEPFFSGRGKGDISEFVKKYKENYEKSEQKGLICIPSGNHDMDRLARSIHGDELKIAFAFLLSMPGAPFIYYGDEIGMRYVENHVSVEGGYNRTGSRSPMQWDDSVNAGFSTAPKEKLYIRQDESSDRPIPALQSKGSIEFVFAEKNTYPFAYLRSDGKEEILVILNPSQNETTFSCRLIPKETVYFFGGIISCENGIITVPGGSAGFYRI